MDALVNSVTQYIDFLVLGAVALLIWSIPFTLHDPIVRWWRKRRWEKHFVVHPFIRALVTAIQSMPPNRFGT